MLMTVFLKRVIRNKEGKVEDENSSDAGLGGSRFVCGVQPRASC